MKVTFIENVLFARTRYRAGQTIDLDDSAAKRLVKSGLCSPTDEIQAAENLDQKDLEPNEKESEVLETEAEESTEEKEVDPFPGLQALDIKEQDDAQETEAQSAEEPKKVVINVKRRRRDTSQKK